MVFCFGVVYNLHISLNENALVQLKEMDECLKKTKEVAVEPDPKYALCGV